MSTVAAEEMEAGSLQRLFAARNVAVVGASADPAKWGHQVVAALLSGGFEGAVYPVNPKGGELLGLHVCTSLAELPEPPDLVVVALPARAVPGALKEAAQAGAGVAVVLATGFREAGNEALEGEILSIARAGGLRLIGPNVMGLAYLPLHLNTMPWPHVETAGPLGVIAQSGTVAAALGEWAAGEGLGVSALLNCGNQVDVCEADFLACLEADRATRAIALHVEGVKSGAAFVAALSRATKPVVVLKSGRSVSGGRAAASHTGSLAGKDGVFSGASRQYGALRVTSLTELYDASKALSTLGTSSGRRVLFLSTSGGSGALAADEAERLGLQVTALPEGFVDELEARGLAPASRANPLDLDTESASDFEVAASLAIERGICEYVVLGFGDPIPGAAEVAGRLQASLPNGTLAYYLGGGGVQVAEAAAMHRHGIPVYPTPERAAFAVFSCVEWTRLKGVAEER